MNAAATLLQLCWLLLQQGYDIIAAPEIAVTDTKIFNDGQQKRYYRHMVFDFSASALYIGAWQHIYRLDMRNIRDVSSRLYKKSEVLRSEPSAIATCQGFGRQADRDYFCKNHVRLIVVQEGGSVLTCGTAAQKPRVFMLAKSDLSIQSTKTGVGYCGRHRDENSTYVFVESGTPDELPSLFATGYISRYHPSINRPELSETVGNQTAVRYPIMLTKRQSTLLNDPQFVATFEVGEYVYFFLREFSIENTQSGQLTYSRVARLCKNDTGYNFGSGQNDEWKTLHKVRLNCSIPAALPYYFHELYDVVKVGDIFYGIFTTNPNGYFASAVCSFNVSTIHAAFDGAFLEQHSRSPSFWGQPVQSQSYTGFVCGVNPRWVNPHQYSFIDKHPFMAESAGSVGDRPLFSIDRLLFRKMAVDRVTGYTVFLLGTYDTIYKIVHWQEGNTTINHILAIWKPFAHAHNVIQVMKLHAGQLYVGTDSTVLQFSVKQCTRYACAQCIRDPYCGWRNGACAAFTPGAKQDVRRERPPTELCHAQRRRPAMPRHGPSRPAPTGGSHVDGGESTITQCDHLGEYVSLSFDAYCNSTSRRPTVTDFVKHLEGLEQSDDGHRITFLVPSLLLAYIFVNVIIHF